MSKRVFINNGDLNPDPFYLTLEEARKLADYLDDKQLKNEIMNAVWEGENMIPIPQTFADIWEDVKAKK